MFCVNPQTTHQGTRRFITNKGQSITLIATLLYSNSKCKQKQKIWQPILHLNVKNLLNNSSWDFEPIFDTRNSYGLCPGQNCFFRSLVFLVNPGLVKWHPLKQTKTQNRHQFISSTFHNQKLCSLAQKDSFTLKVLKMEFVFGWD